MKRTKKLLCCLGAIAILLSSLSIYGSALTTPDDERCKSSLVYCIEAEQLLYEKNIDEIVYPTGLVKLMTAILASEYAVTCEDGFETLCTVSASAYHSTEGNDIDLRINEQISIYNLMVGLLLGGANDCANVLAERVAGSIDGFVEMMNEKAAEIGMPNTWFTNPTGMHDDNMVTTARDMLALGKYAMANSYVNEIASEMTVVIPATNKSEQRAIGTRNYLVSPRTTERYYLDISTGLMCGNTAQGGYCIIGTASNNGNNFIAVVMGADYETIVDQEEILMVDEEGNFMTDENGNYYVLQDRKAHTDYYSFIIASRLLKWADKSFSFIKAIDRSTPICEVPVRLAKSIDRITLLPESPIEIYVPTDIDRDKDIVCEYTLDKTVLYAPIAAGEKIGTVSVYYKGEFIGTVPLIVNTTVEQDSFLVIFNTAKEIAKTPIAIAIIGIMLLFSVMYIVISAVDIAKQERAKAKARIPGGRKYLNQERLTDEPEWLRQKPEPFFIGQKSEGKKQTVKRKKTGLFGRKLKGFGRPTISKK